MIPLPITDREALNEAFHDALSRALPSADEASRQAWAAEHAEEIQTEVQLHLAPIVRKLATPFAEREVKKAALEFIDGERITRLWVLDSGQHAILADRRDFFFHAGATASLIYEQTGPDIGHRATELPLGNRDMWEWIQDFMQRGFKAQPEGGE